MSKTSTATVPRAEHLTSRERFLGDVLDGLRRPQKEIPCKYFYDEHGSMLFDLICEVDEYYPTRTELSILRLHAREMAEAIGEDCVLIELGSGSSLKTRLLIEQLREPRAYLPVDISREHLERSAQALADRFPGLRVVPVHADFTAPFSLPKTGDPRARRVVYFPGSTIGNFSPDAARGLLRDIARLAGHGGGLLIGFDLEKSEDILLPAYNDRRGITAAFNLNVLSRINRELGADFDLDAFQHAAIYVRDKERVEMHLISRRPQVVKVGGLAFGFGEGETIHTESSHKYPLDHIRRLTTDAGFRLQHQWLDARRFFAVQYLTVD